MYSLTIFSKDRTATLPEVSTSFYDSAYLQAVVHGLEIEQNPLETKITVPSDGSGLLFRRN